MKLEAIPTIRLNLGSGPSAVPGWTNIDRSPNLWLQRIPGAKEVLLRLQLLGESHMTKWDANIQQGDIRRLPYGEGTVDVIYSSHTLEHLYLDDARKCIAEMRRVLHPDGILRLALPDSENLARTLVDANGSAEASLEFNRRLLAHPEQKPGLLTRLRGAAGGHVHRWQPTNALVQSMLRDAGFTRVETQSYRSGELPDLFNIETRAEGFFVEARP